MTADPPLKGMLVLDLSHAMSGPLLGWFLGGLGATVLKLERPKIPDAPPRLTLDFGGIYPNHEPGERPWNREGVFNFVNANKKGLTLRLDNEVGRKLFIELAQRADVVIENFSARVMSNLGIDYSTLSKVNPRLVFVSIKSHGALGPKKDYVGFVETVNAEVGFANLFNYGDGVPQSSKFPMADITAAIWSYVCTMKALADREETGQGRFIDMAMTDCLAGVMDDCMVQAQLSPPGWSSSNEIVPIVSVKCRDGRWITVCKNDVTDQALARVSGVASNGKEQHDPESAIGEFATRNDGDKLVSLLADAGIRACAIDSGLDISADPEFGDWFWTNVDHPEVGVQRQPRIPYDFDPTADLVITPAPMFAEHSRWVLEDILGMNPEEVTRLAEAGVI